MQTLPSRLPWTAEIDGDDLVVHNILATCFGGKYDRGDNGLTESGVRNDGSDPSLLGVALPIRSTEKATACSPLAFKGPHIPWGTKVMVWREADGEDTALACQLIDNGPNVFLLPRHAIDLNPKVVLKLDPTANPATVANSWISGGMSYRIIGGARYIS